MNTWVIVALIVCGTLIALGCLFVAVVAIAVKQQNKFMKEIEEDQNKWLR